MKILTENAMATLLAIYTVGNGLPAYLFNGHNISDAIEGGFVKDVNKSLYVTEDGETALKEFIETGRVTSFQSVLLSSIKNEGKTH